MADAFTERWKRKEHECGLVAIASKMVTFEEWVLPRDAAPCMSFRQATRQSRVWEVFGAQADWSAEDRTRLAAYCVIGSDGAGNPVCVEQRSCAVWLLDHEDWFGPRQFVNSSIPQLAECLLAYMGETEPERFRRTVHEIDPHALTDGAFWWHEAAVIGSA